MSDCWFYERTTDGWQIRDENRLLVAVVPDALHDREADAQRIACSACAESAAITDANRPARPRPHVRLAGTDGNAFAALGRALRALRDAGWPKPERDAFAAEATSGDYDQLLGTIMKHLDVE